MPQSPFEEQVDKFIQAVNMAAATKDQRRAIQHIIEGMRAQAAITGAIVLAIDGLISPGSRMDHGIQGLREAVVEDERKQANQTEIAEEAAAHPITRVLRYP